MNDKKPIFDMGSETAEIFRGRSSSEAVKELYGMSAVQFADIIRHILPVTDKEYSLLDVGSSKGELLVDLLKLLPEYRFKATVTDVNPRSVADNSVVGTHMVADAEELPFANGSMEVAIMRYVLQFNSLQSQEKIISELYRVVNKLAIIQHGGADDKTAEVWRENVSKIFISDSLPQLKRSGMYWSSAEEIEKFMKGTGMRFERVQSKKIDGLSQVFIERYSLNDPQAQELRELLKGTDFIIQTTWVIHPKL